MFVRVKDPDTGHEFDLPEGHRLIRLDLVRPVKSKRYPPSARPRAAKHHLNFTGRPVGDQPNPSGEGETEKENSDG